MPRKFDMRMSVLACALMLAVGSAEARTLEGIEFPESFRAGAREMKLRGAGLLRYKVLCFMFAL